MSAMPGEVALVAETIFQSVHIGDTLSLMQVWAHQAGNSRQEPGNWTTAWPGTCGIRDSGRGAGGSLPVWLTAAAAAHHRDAKGGQEGGCNRGPYASICAAPFPAQLPPQQTLPTASLFCQVPHFPPTLHPCPCPKVLQRLQKNRVLPLIRATCGGASPFCFKRAGPPVLGPAWAPCWHSCASCSHAFWLSPVRAQPPPMFRRF